MSPARRLAVLAALGVLAFGLGIGVGSAAQAGIGWSVDGVVVAAPTSDAVVRVSGTIEAAGLAGTITDVRVVFTRTLEARPGCADTVEGSQAAYVDDDDPQADDPEPPEDPRTFAFDVPVSFAAAGSCNDQYTIAVFGTLDGPADAGADPEIDDTESPPQPYADEEGVPIVVPVAAPPADVPEVRADVTPGRLLGVGWLPPPGYTEPTGCSGTGPADRPDFVGYEVIRQIGDAPPTTVATIASSPGATGVAHCYFEQLTPDAVPGEYRFTVYALRSSPGGVVRSAGAATATATVTVAAPPTTTATTAAPQPPRPPGTTRVVAGGSTGGVAAGTVPPTPSEDGTFEEELDYPEPGEEAAEVPDDADTFLDFVPSPGPGILVPFAIAECLAVWAFHLRYLARRADDGY